MTERKPAECEVPGCEADVHLVGLCVAHYSRYRRRMMVHPRTGRLMASKPRKKKDPTLGKYGVPDGRIPGRCKGCYQQRRVDKNNGYCKSCWSRLSSGCVDPTDIAWLSIQAGDGDPDDLFDDLNEEE